MEIFHPVVRWLRAGCRHPGGLCRGRRFRWHLALGHGLGALAELHRQAPIQALEFGRRVIPSRVRPGFNEMEQYCKKITAEPTAEGAAAAPAPA